LAAQGKSAFGVGANTVSGIGKRWSEVKLSRAQVGSQ
jgi:hypothetical protein